MTFCSLGANCAVWDPRLKVAGVSVYSDICEGCRMRTVSELRMLRLDYFDLTQLLPVIGAVGEVRISRPKPESTPPLNLPAFTLRHQIAHVVLLADAFVRERFGPPGPDITRESVALDHALRHLETRVGDLAALEHVDGWWDLEAEGTQPLSGPQVLLMLGALHRRARLMLGLSTPTLSMPGECPTCQVSALRRHADEPEKIWCQACKAAMDRSRYMQVVSLRNCS
jgi:hypothetical protein